MPDRPRRHPRLLAATLAALALLAGAATAAAAPPDVTLGFTEPVPGTIADRDGQGTGFTVSMAGATVVAGNLDVTGGSLRVVTTAGDAFGSTAGTDDTQDNALATTFDGSDDYRVAATLRGPLALSGGSQGAGIFIGTGEDSYIKLIAGRTSGGAPRIQMRHEGGATVGSANPAIDKSPVSAVGTGTRIDLTLEFDKDTGEVEGSYSINGGANTKVGTMTLPGLGDASDTAGIISTSTGGPPTTFVYDAFVVEPKVFLSFEAAQIIHTFATIGGDPAGGKQFPTSVAVGPSGRLYASGQYGRIHILQRDANDNATYVKQLPDIFDTPNQTFSGAPQPGEKGRLVTGIVVAPGSTVGNQVLYVSHSDPQIFEAQVPGQSTVYPASGRVTKLVLNAANTVVSRQDIVIGLPRSAENHAPNGMAFGPDGWLYLGVGGNTNAGDQSLEFGYFPETPLSGSVVRINPAAIGGGTVNLTALSTFTFQDPCTGTETPGQGCSAAATVPTISGAQNPLPGVDPAKVQLYATGFRNPYDVVWHSTQNKLYANENEHNDEFGQTAGSTSSPQGVCPGAPQNPGTPPDHLEWVRQSLWHGHPNPSRGAGECALNGGAQAIGSYAVVGLGSFNGARSSTSGLAEYTSGALPLLTGQLLSASYVTGKLARAQLNPGGTSAGVVELASGFSASVDLAVTEKGNIIVAELTTGGGNGGRLSVLRPDTSEAGCFLGEATDSDGDGYSDQDEIDNRSQRCNAASTPGDFDRDGLSDLNDPDDDNDTIADTADPFQRDATNGGGTALPFVLGFNTSTAGGWYGTGFGGIQLSSNGGGPLAGLVGAGGAGGFLGVSATPGTAEGAANNQHNALQQGFDARGPFTSSTIVGEPFGADGAQGGAGTSLYFGPGENDHVKISIRANNGSPIIQLAAEQGGAVSEVRRVALALPASAVRLFLVGQPGTRTVTGQYQIGAAPVQNLGSVTVPAGWFSTGAATGIMSTSLGAPKAGFVYDEFRIEAGGTVSAVGPGAQPPTSRPRRPGVVINNGRRYVNTRRVTLRITPVAGARRVRISHRAALRGPGTRTVTLRKSGRYAWTLLAATRPYSKRVYVRFLGPGVGAKRYADAIILDRVKPVVLRARLLVVGSRARLVVRARDNISKVAAYQVRRDRRGARFVRFSRSRVLTGTAGRTISVRVRDGAGNVSRWVPVVRR